MTRLRAGLARAAQTCLLLAASVLVPRSVRTEWLNEWRGELWQARHAYGSRGWTPVWRTTAFCLGSFQDAADLRSAHSPWLQASVQRGSPYACIFCLAAILILTATVCLLSPNVRLAFQPLPDGVAALHLISQQGDLESFRPTIPLSEYRAWVASNSHLLEGFAFYAPGTASIHVDGQTLHPLRIGYATENLSRVLKLSLPQRRAMAVSSNLPILVLSDRAEKALKPGIRLLPGQLVSLKGRTAMFGGTAPASLWRIPGQLQGIVFESSAVWTEEQPDTPGFVLSSAPAKKFQRDTENRSYLIIQGSRDNEVFECLSLEHRRKKPLLVLLFALLMACLALPATTPLPLGDYPTGRHLLSYKSRVRHWLFLMAKLALIVPAIGCMGALLAYAWMPLSEPSAILTQLLFSLFGLLFAFRWALRDQRARCPTCLAVLTSGASVGYPSHCFLAWSGTELVCPVGHGLLHIPEHPTSWFRNQRWLCLGHSWSELFREHVA